MFVSLRPARFGLFNTALVATALVLGPVPVSSQTVGVNSAVRNTVRIKQGAAAPAEQAKIKQPVKMGNAITTGVNSGLQVTLLDQSSLTLGPNGSLTVDRFVYNPATKSASVASSVTKGAFRFMSGRAAGGGRNSMTTPAASIGIRGTMLEGAVGAEAIAIAGLQAGLPSGAAVDPATATVIVLRGPGPQAPGTVRKGLIDVTAGGKAVTLSQPGNAVFIPRAGAAPIPFQLNNLAFQHFDVVLRTQPSTFLARIGSRSQVQNARNQASGNTGGQTAESASGGSTTGGRAGGTGTRLASIVARKKPGLFGSTGGILGTVGLATAGIIIVARDSSPGG